MQDPTGDIASEHTRAELLRGSFLLFALELALRSHTHTHTFTAAYTHIDTHTHMRSLSAFFTLLHQSVPKLFPHFGEFPRLIPWHKWRLGLITLAWTHRVCPVPALHARSKTSYLPLLVVSAKLQETTSKPENICINCKQRCCPPRCTKTPQRPHPSLMGRQSTATNSNLIKEYKFRIYSGTPSDADFPPLSVS